MNDLATKFFLFEWYYPYLVLLIAGGIKTSALVVLALAITAYLKQRSARARCWVWRLCFVGMAFLLVFSTTTTVMALRPAVTFRFSQKLSQDFPKEAVGARLIRTDRDAQHVADIRREQSSGATVVKSPWEIENRIPMPTDYQVRPWSYIEASAPWAWAIGSFLLFIYFLGSTVLGMFWLKRNSRPDKSELTDNARTAGEQFGLDHEPIIRISGAIASPLLFGFFRPSIYLPETASTWDRQKISSVFLHEMAHWARKDFAWFQFSRFMLAVFWWNPLTLLAFRQLRAESEEAADDEVVTRTNEASVYARALVEIAAAAPLCKTHSGISMLGHCSLEQRIRRLMADNLWRGRLGKLAGGIIAIAAILSIYVASVYLAVASPASDQSASVKSNPMSPEQRKIVGRIIENTKKRIAAFRFTHAFAEMIDSRTSEGRTQKSTIPSKMEAWNDSWTDIHKAEFRPGVSVSEDQSQPFRFSDVNDICDGNASYYLYLNEPDLISSPQKPRAMYFDYLGMQESVAMIRMLDVVQKNSSLSSPYSSYSISNIEWKGSSAIEIQEKLFSADKALIQQRTFVVIPAENDMIRFSELAYPSTTPNNPASQWIVGSVEKASNGEYFPSVFSYVAWSEGTKSTREASVKRMEVLTELPKGITELPKANDAQYTAPASAVIRRSKIIIKCVDTSTGKPMPSTAIAVRVNSQPSQALHTDEHGTLEIPLPHDDVTYLSASASQSGFVPRVVAWRKYGDPLQLPESYQFGMEKAVPISGRVVDDSGNPIEGASVEMYVTGGHRSWTVFTEHFALSGVETKTNVKGEWSLADFPANLSGLDYRISCQGYKATTDSGISDFRQDTGLSYESLRDGTATITLHHGLELTGKITDDTGLPVQSCRVTIGRDIHGSNCPVAETNAKGEYLLRGLSVGKYWITAESNSHEPVAQEIDLPSSVPVNFILKAGQVIKGSVTMPDGTPCAGLNVGVDTWNNLRTLTFHTQTDAQGSFIWAGAPDAPVEFVFGACQSREFLSGLWLNPSGAVQSVVMKPALRFAGTVVDAKTGRSIKAFTITPGRVFENQSTDWVQYSMKTYANGVFDWKSNRMGDTFVFRFAATGYKSYVTRQYKKEQQDVTEVVRLDPE